MVDKIDGHRCLSLVLPGRMLREGETYTRVERQTQTGTEAARDEWDVVFFSLYQLFVRSFVTKSTSHPDARGYGGCEEKAVEKYQDLTEGERKVHKTTERRAAHM